MNDLRNLEKKLHKKGQGNQNLLEHSQIKILEEIKKIKNQLNDKNK